MAQVNVLRSDTLEEFRQKFNSLSEYVGDIPDDSPVTPLVQYVYSLAQEVSSLVIPFYNSAGVAKDIPLKRS